MPNTQLQYSLAEREGKVDLSFSSIKKKGHDRFLQKHIKNAKELAKTRTKLFVNAKVNSWLKEGEVSQHTIHTYFKCIKQLIKLMGYHYKKNLFWPTIIYADKFIRSSNPVQEDQLFQLILISALITVKFWEDTGVDADLASYVSGLSKKQISDFERKFLKQIDYSLLLSNDDIQSFRAPTQSY